MYFFGSTFNKKTTPHSKSRSRITRPKDNREMLMQHYQRSKEKTYFPIFQKSTSFLTDKRYYDRLVFSYTNLKLETIENKSSSQIRACNKSPTFTRPRKTYYFRNEVDTAAAADYNCSSKLSNTSKKINSPIKTKMRRPKGVVENVFLLDSPPKRRTMKRISVSPTGYLYKITKNRYNIIERSKSPAKLNQNSSLISSLLIKYDVKRVFIPSQTHKIYENDMPNDHLTHSSDIDTVNCSTIKNNYSVVMLETEPKLLNIAVAEVEVVPIKLQKHIVLEIDDIQQTIQDALRLSQSKTRRKRKSGIFLTLN